MVFELRQIGKTKFHISSIFVENRIQSSPKVLAFFPTRSQWKASIFVENHFTNTSSVWFLAVEKKDDKLQFKEKWFSFQFFCYSNSHLYDNIIGQFDVFIRGNTLQLLFVEVHACVFYRPCDEDMRARSVVSIEFSLYQNTCPTDIRCEVLR